MTKADFLASTEVVDWDHPDVRQLAGDLAANESEPVAIAQKCFEWVRDEIEHSMDFGRTELTCKASEVLARRTGFCYAKSHLLAALLRANGIPAGFCYQRLSIDGIGPPFSFARPQCRLARTNLVGIGSMRAETSWAWTHSFRRRSSDWRFQS